MEYAMTASTVASEISSGNGFVGLARLYRMPMAAGELSANHAATLRRRYSSYVS